MAPAVHMYSHTHAHENTDHTYTPFNLYPSANIRKYLQSAGTVKQSQKSTRGKSFVCVSVCFMIGQIAELLFSVCAPSDDDVDDDDVHLKTTSS